MLNWQFGCKFSENIFPSEFESIASSLPGLLWKKLVVTFFVPSLLKVLGASLWFPRFWNVTIMEIRCVCFCLLYWAPDGMDPSSLALHVLEYQEILNSEFYFSPLCCLRNSIIIQILSLLDWSSYLFFPTFHLWFFILLYLPTFLLVFCFWVVLFFCPQVFLIKKKYPIWFHGCNTYFESLKILMIQFRFCLSA